MMMRKVLENDPDYPRANSVSKNIFEDPDSAPLSVTNATWNPPEHKHQGILPGEIVGDLRKGNCGFCQMGPEWTHDHLTFLVREYYCYY